MKRIVSTLIVLAILMTGTVFGDNLITNPGFETQMPAFWSPLNGTMDVDVGWVQAPNPVYGGRVPPVPRLAGSLTTMLTCTGTMPRPGLTRLVPT
jgi:hypothetical protein